MDMGQDTWQREPDGKALYNPQGAEERLKKIDLLPEEDFKHLVEWYVRKYWGRPT